VLVNKVAAGHSVFMGTENTVTLLRMEMVYVAASMIVYVFLAVIVCVNVGEIAVAVLLVEFEEMVVIVGLSVSASAVSVMNINNVLAMVRSNWLVRKRVHMCRLWLLGYSRLFFA